MIRYYIHDFIFCVGLGFNKLTERARDHAPLIFIGCIVLILFIGAAAIGLASAGTTEAIQHVSRY